MLVIKLHWGGRGGKWEDVDHQDADSEKNGKRSFPLVCLSLFAFSVSLPLSHHANADAAFFQLSASPKDGECLYFRPGCLSAHWVVVLFSQHVLAECDREQSASVRGSWRARQRADES